MTAYISLLPTAITKGGQDYSDIVFIQPIPSIYGAVMSTSYMTVAVLSPRSSVNIPLDLTPIRNAFGQSIVSNYQINIVTVIKHFSIATNVYENIYVNVVDSTMGTVFGMVASNGGTIYTSALGIPFSSGYISIVSSSYSTATIYVTMIIQGQIYNPNLPVQLI